MAATALVRRGPPVLRHARGSARTGFPRAIIAPHSRGMLTLLVALPVLLAGGTSAITAPSPTPSRSPRHGGETSRRPTKSPLPGCVAPTHDVEPRSHHCASTTSAENPHASAFTKNPGIRHRLWVAGWWERVLTDPFSSGIRSCTGRAATGTGPARGHPHGGRVATRHAREPPQHSAQPVRGPLPLSPRSIHSGGCSQLSVCVRQGASHLDAFDVSAPGVAFGWVTASRCAKFTLPYDTQTARPPVV